jgi:hypothetical protein
VRRGGLHHAKVTEKSDTKKRNAKKNEPVSPDAMGRSEAPKVKDALFSVIHVTAIRDLLAIFAMQIKEKTTWSRH